MTPNHGLMWAT